MKSTVQKFIQHSAIIIKGVFGKRAKVISPLCGLSDKVICREVMQCLTGELKFPAPPYKRSDLRLLHGKLAYYQRVRMHGRVEDKIYALKKLEKQWRKTKRNQMRCVDV